MLSRSIECYPEALRLEKVHAKRYDDIKLVHPSERESQAQPRLGEEVRDRLSGQFQPQESITGWNAKDTEGQCLQELNNNIWGLSQLILASAYLD